MITYMLFHYKKLLNKRFKTILKTEKYNYQLKKNYLKNF